MARPRWRAAHAQAAAAGDRSGPGAARGRSAAGDAGARKRGAGGGDAGDRRDGARPGALHVQRGEGERAVFGRRARVYAGGKGGARARGAAAGGAAGAAGNARLHRAGTPRAGRAGAARRGGEDESQPRLRGRRPMGRLPRAQCAVGQGVPGRLARAGARRVVLHVRRFRQEHARHLQARAQGHRLGAQAHAGRRAAAALCARADRGACAVRRRVATGGRRAAASAQLRSRRSPSRGATGPPARRRRSRSSSRSSPAWRRRARACSSTPTPRSGSRTRCTSGGSRGWWKRFAATRRRIRCGPRCSSTELLPYQLDGIAFAAGAGRAVLADEMGLGKTIQGVGVAELLADGGGGAARAHHLPGLAEIAVGGGDRALQRAQRATGRRPFRGARGAVPERRVFHRLQLRTGAARLPLHRARAVGSDHPRRGAAHQELGGADEPRGQVVALALRPGPHRHADREPARRSLLHRRVHRRAAARAGVPFLSPASHRGGKREGARLQEPRRPARATRARAAAAHARLGRARSSGARRPRSCASRRPTSSSRCTTRT